MTGARHRKPTFVIGALLFVVGCAWLARCAQLTRTAYRELRIAQHHLGALRSKEAINEVLSSQSNELLDAQQSLHAARSSLHSAWLWPFHAGPLSHQQLQSALDITDTTSAIVDIAVDARQVTGAGPFASLNRAEQLVQIATLARRLGAIVDHPRLGPTTAVAPQLLVVRRQVAETIARLRPAVDQANAALPGLVLAANGPRHYLLVAANNAEMAAGSGLPLAVTTVDVRGGIVTFGTWKWSGDLVIPAGSAPLAPELGALWSFASPDTDIRRALVSPRFPSTAPLIAAEYDAATGEHVDGVVLIDIVGLQKIVAASPRALQPGALAESQVIPELLHDQYVTVDSTLIGSHQQREEKLGEQARQAAKLLVAPDSNLPKLIRGLADAVAGRHVLLWSAHNEEQKAFAALHADGELSQDSVMVNLQNVASNKLDWFARLTTDLRVDRGQDGMQHVTATVTVTNPVPDGEPAYVAGPSSTARRYGQYVGYLTINVPADATELRLGNASPVIVRGRDGSTQVIGQIVAIDAKATATVTFHFTLPPGARRLRIEPSARFPGITWSYQGEQWLDDQPHSVALS